MSYRISAILGTTLLLALAAGCGSSPATVAPEQNPSFGPHGGPTAALPEQKGFIEIVQEPTGGQSRLVAYCFSTRDMASALSPVPSSLQFSMDLPGGGAQNVAFTAEPKPGDPGGEARFISQPGEFEVDPLLGTVTIAVDGQNLTAKLSGAIR